MIAYSKSIKIKFDIKCITGLHIGGSKDNFEIGGIDNPVIKVPMTFKIGEREIKEGMPYIPGSSLKGKLRSLLDWKYQTFKIKTKKDSSKIISFYSETDFDLNDTKKISLLFGAPAEQAKKYPYGPPRLKFFDSYPSKKTIENWNKVFGEGIYTEIKYENQIDRLTSNANPRPIERVPAGSIFEAEVIFDIFQFDTSNNGEAKFYEELFQNDLENYNVELLKIFLEGLKLLENSFLGGGGSRGNGRVKIENLRINNENLELNEIENNKLKELLK